MAFGGKNRSTISNRWLGAATPRWAQRRFVAWLGILALVLQLGSAPAHRQMAGSDQSDALAALGALSALLGPNVALCLHEEDSPPASPPHGPHNCCADCIACHAGAQAAALVPCWHYAPVPTTRIVRTLRFAGNQSVAITRSEVAAQPRAPPALV